MHVQTYLHSSFGFPVFGKRKLDELPRNFLSVQHDQLCLYAQFSFSKLFSFCKILLTAQLLQEGLTLLCITLCSVIQQAQKLFTETNDLNDASNVCSISYFRATGLYY